MAVYRPSIGRALHSCRWYFGACFSLRASLDPAVDNCIASPAAAFTFPWIDAAGTDVAIAGAIVGRTVERNWNEMPRFSSAPLSSPWRTSPAFYPHNRHRSARSHPGRCLWGSSGRRPLGKRRFHHQAAQTRQDRLHQPSSHHCRASDRVWIDCWRELEKSPPSRYSFSFYLRKNRIYLGSGALWRDGAAAGLFSATSCASAHFAQASMAGPP